ncbi:phage tail protein [Marinomonas primoryensis]|uniref:Phage tail protein n=1 Tax=Marinomonas primoryensis TaxID=178399 RepID=A0A2Z4PM88_9GAMM|nr:phage tail sheath subtilisin-like domain-containing protein [Marinomonas primoryensis]AWX98562.1 phage tail protein [Marinomonas primoryensis]AWX98674.1 phage tail protein [Marinomonas primoryensis]
MSLGNIPEDVKVPLVYIDIDNSGALTGTPTLVNKVLIIGQQLSSGTATALDTRRIGTSEADMDNAYGKGSMLAKMLKRFRAINASTDMYALGVADLEGSVATGTITTTVTTASAGVIALLIDGMSVQVAVKDADDATAVATAIVAAVNAKTDLPVTAAAEAGVVTLTCKWKGITGNDIDIRINYYDGEVTAKGVTVTSTIMTGGAGTPDIAAIVAAIPDEWYNHIALPYSDTQSLNGLRDELVDRYGPLKMMEGIAYTAMRGTFAETSTWGEGRNDYLITCMGTNKTPSNPWDFAAAYGARASYSLAIDPARPLQTLVLTGILPPAKTDRWDWTERNLLLQSGVATYMVTAGDEVAIEREVSTYKVNSYGDPDPSYLDITTPATLGYLRYSLKAMVTNRFPRHKLAGDDVLDFIDPGQPIVTPKIMRNAIIELARIDWVPKGLMEDMEGFKASLSVYRDESNKNRLNCVWKPNIVNQLRVFAALTQFKL